MHKACAIPILLTSVELDNFLQMHGWLNQENEQN